LLAFHFQLPDGLLEITAQGRVAWANPNGQTGVHFLDIPESLSNQLSHWLKSAANNLGADVNETVPHCKLTDLSLGGCYVETEAPFPEHSLVDLCLKTDMMEVHTEGMVRVTHPGHGMGVEFPSRTSEQRAQVGNLIEVLRSSPEAAPELTISPRALLADLSQFESSEPQSGNPQPGGLRPGDPRSGEQPEESFEMEDPLLDLLRRGTTLLQEDFVAELHHQRNPESVASL